MSTITRLQQWKGIIRRAKEKVTLNKCHGAAGQTESWDCWHFFFPHLMLSELLLRLGLLEIESGGGLSPLLTCPVLRFAWTAWWFHYDGSSLCHKSSRFHCVSLCLLPTPLFLKQRCCFFSWFLSAWQSKYSKRGKGSERRGCYANPDPLWGTASELNKFTKWLAAVCRLQIQCL